jgi:hypothetical protein
MVPFLVIALAAIVVGFIYIVIGTIEWISGKKHSFPAATAYTNNKTPDLEQDVKRLQEIATLERNARITSENK